ncbi:acyltransferase [Shewanella frigidimarina]|uniref:acyltransferase n=1 Tax=Shewanella frigidimarina TaxID=56812 RepID=UPI003F9F63AF
MIKYLKLRIQGYKVNNLILFCFFKRLRRKPYFFGFDFMVCYIYSSYLSYVFFGFSVVPRVFFSSDLFRVVIDRSKCSKVVSNKKLAIVFESFQHGVDRTVFNLGKCSKLQVCNTITIGNGCTISLFESATLTFQGELNNQSSGITCQTKILCANNIYIGGGTIISWACYITDTSNHYINGVLVNDAVSINNNVWVSEGCTIAAGAIIGEGSIVGSKSFVRGSFPINSLIAGCPAKLKRENVNWKR